ncbi:class I SAM-dependent methyltransferase [Candidatus Woesearchaeota archaeon]|nr:class I SAM-dependent methyltransferase [Candidatus Woesearchaeota archaeon]
MAFKQDEYEQGDPYLGENPNSRFFKERLKINLKLVKSVKGKRLLDIACGRGYYSNEFSKYFNVDAIDLSRKAIEFAKSKFPNVEFKRGNCYSMPYRNGLYDIVVCNNIIEHIKYPKKLLKEANRVLKKRGYILISTPNKYRLTNIINIILNMPLKMASKYHFKEYSHSEIKKILKSNNFTLIKMRYIHTISPKKDLKSRLFNFVNSLLIMSRIRLFSSTFFYLCRKNN